MSDSDSNSYGQILKSSSIIGGVAIVTLILGIIRTKFSAILIGTTGVGLTASFTAMQGFVGAIAGLGTQASAVREIAAAYAKGDEQEVGQTVLTLRRISWVTSLLGALSMLLLSPLLSQLTFSSNEYQWDIAAIGLIILFSNLSGGQTALLQGARRIADMAKAQMVSAILGTAITVGFYFYLGLRGIIPSLVLMAVIQLVISWYLAKRLPVPRVEMTWRQSFKKAGAIVKLGSAMMCTGLMSSAVTYATTALVAQEINVQAVGIYSAAFALSGIFVNFTLDAMSADYYPRLVAAADDQDKVNRLVNEQTEIGLLLTLPGLLAAMLLAPWIIQIIYTKEFLAAVELIQWFILGCLGRIISWPILFVLIANKRIKIYLQLELLWNALHITLITLGIFLYGITGVAIAYPILYVIVTVQSLFVVKSITSFMWFVPARNLVLGAVTATGLVFVACRLPQSSALTVALFALILLTGIISLRGLASRLGSEHSFVRRLSALPFCNPVRRKKVH